MEKLRELRDKITNYMNNIPVEKRKGIVILFSVIIGLLFILKCIVSIMMADKPKQTISEKIEGIRDDVKEEYKENRSHSAPLDSFMQMLDEIEKRHERDTLSR